MFNISKERPRISIHTEPGRYIGPCQLFADLSKEFEMKLNEDLFRYNHQI